jgi:imidazolonepropionase-like amidohydrolase
MLAIKAGRLIDGLGGAVLPDAVVLVDDRKITAVGPAQSLSIPAGAEVANLGDYTVMPGMIDCHLHLAAFNHLTFDDFRVGQWETTPQLQQMYALFHAQLCFEMGFTTLRDMGWSGTRGLITAEMCAVRDAIDAGLFAGPRILVGAWVVITGAHLDLLFPRAAMRVSGETADGPWDLRALARRNIRAGCDLLKTCASGGGGTDREEPNVRNMTQEELDAVVDEAHAFLKPAAVHCFTPESQRKAVKGGADTLEHMVFTDDEAIQAIVEARTCVTPTLAHRTDRAIEIRRETGGTRFSLDKMKRIQPHCFETFRRMHAAGVRIAMGTDTSYDPDMGNNAYELEVYVELGMTPMEAILTTTRDAADAIGLGEKIGTLEVGKYADMVAVDGDPLQDIRVLQERKRIVMVMKDGQVHIDRRPGHETEVLASKPGEWKMFGI